MNRRSFLAGAGLLAGAPLAGLFAGSAGRRRVLRAAHITDVHLLRDAPGLEQPEEGLAAALRHAQGQPDRPDMILFGGDLIMDALKATKEEAIDLWKLWERVFSAEIRLPHHFALGNHDIWGWAIRDRPSIERDPDYGKGLAMRRLGLARPYYSFDRAGWHFVVLDSMQRDYGTPMGYLTRLDDEQFYWLAEDLSRTGAVTPVCVLSHVPIIAVCPLVDNHMAASGSNWTIPGLLTHRDALRIKNLFNRHPNVKLCLSGHVHLADDVTYRGVRYCCNGAVCADWWKGPYGEYAPAYALVDFYDDGTVENRLVPYRPDSSAKPAALDGA